MLQVAHCELLVKASSSLAAINSGISREHVEFWMNVDVLELFSIYSALTSSPARVLKLLEDAEEEDVGQQRILSYLRQFTGTMNPDELRNFLRFTTGASICISAKIDVMFNHLTGIARCPIAHTCHSAIEVSVDYGTYHS